MSFDDILIGDRNDRGVQSSHRRKIPLWWKITTTSLLFTGLGAVIACVVILVRVSS